MSVDTVDSDTPNPPPSTTADIKYYFHPKIKNAPAELKRKCKFCECVFVSFFTRLSTINLCLFRTKHNAMDDPLKWTLGEYGYSHNSANSNLRGHLERVHREEYNRLANENGWVNHMPEAKSLRKAIALSKAPMSRSIPFTAVAFVNHLVRFITVNDQVSDYSL